MCSVDIIVYSKVGINLMKQTFNGNDTDQDAQLRIILKNNHYEPLVDQPQRPNDYVQDVVTDTKTRKTRTTSTSEERRQPRETRTTSTTEER